MTKQRNATLTTDNIQPEARRSLLGEARRTFALGVLALLILLLPGSILAAPIVVTINDIPNGAPVIEVFGAPNGYNIYTGDCVNNPAIENGALITLFGVDTAGSIPDWSGRFVIPNAPDPSRAGVDIVWVQHDNSEACDLFGNNDLQVGFNSAFPGTYYGTPVISNSDENLGVVTDKWVQVYTSDTLIILFDPHTYRLRN